MATVQTILDSARYDLGDYQTGLMWDDAELLVYLNRIVGIMDSQLATLNSDLVEAEETSIDCVASQNYVDLSSMNSGLWDSIRQVWISQTRIVPISIDLMRYKRKFRSGTSKPYYYTVQDRTLLWDSASDDTYTGELAISYNKKTAVLTASSSMPYNDIFNEFFRSQLVIYAKSKKEGGTQGDAADAGSFRKRAMEEQIRRDFVKKYYYIDF